MKNFSVWFIFCTMLHKCFSFLSSFDSTSSFVFLFFLHFHFITFLNFYAGVGCIETWILGLSGRSFSSSAFRYYCFWSATCLRWKWGGPAIISKRNKGKEPFTPCIKGKKHVVLSSCENLLLYSFWFWWRGWIKKFWKLGLLLFYSTQNHINGIGTGYWPFQWAFRFISLPIVLLEISISPPQCVQSIFLTNQP